ncbi:hypothetical protein, partial [Actinoplanes sp. NPDC026623]|uniref:tetratricopeptide repeat-containing glycosyltransferase n=1 Tax=Actinoplanes sp. NPDC026623 TaxID=3155610 RepID=UPI0033C394BB
LIVDADEIVSGDPTALRNQLTTTSRPTDALLVHNASMTEAGGVSLWSTRVFRTGEYRYSGRLHEQVTHRFTGESPPSEATDAVALTHSGYLVATVATKDKVGRNRRLAALAISEGPEAHYNLARTELDAGNPTTAIEACRAGLDADPSTLARVGLLSILIRSCAKVDRLPEANEALAELREIAYKKVTVDQAEVVVRAAEGDHERVLELLEGMPEADTDDRAVGAGRSHMRSYEINSLMATGRPGEAAEILRAALRDGRLVLPLDVIATVLQGAGSDLTELARLIPEDAVRQVLYATRQVTPTLAEAVVEALWERFPGDPQLFGVVVWLAGQLPLDRAIQWSGRLRQQGLEKYCPLLATATATDRSARERALAAAAALELFGDQAALAPLSDALAQIPDDQTTAVLDDLHTLAPGVASAIESV